ncbi:MAG: CotH kinase family protein [Myxococcota bacterium]|nr:CotH kinase family protein [Myxococcota bacterium]
MFLLLACTAPRAPLPLDESSTDTGASVAVETVTSAAASGSIPAVVLNEIQADNDATIMSDGLVFSDWVELYNASPEVVSLSRLELSDGDGARWEGGAGELAPGERVLLWADSDLPFGLSRDGERLELLVDGIVSDRLATGQMNSDTAWARYPDGGQWALTARPTPGWTNGSHPGDSTDPSDAFFQVDHVTPISVWITDDQWAALTLDNYTYVEASVSTGAAWFDRVGFRKKSTVGSNRSLDDKAAFKIDLNRYEDHRLGGQEVLTLNNMVQDPTYVAEHLAYMLFRSAGIPAPRVGYVRLSINGEDWGLYALIENVDDTFLDRWYADSSGVLYEGAYGTDLVVGALEDLEVDEGDAGAREDLVAVAEILSGEASDDAIAALEQRVDLDSLLLNMGIEAAILHWDGYTTANNYRLYHDPQTDRLQLLPWGTDQTFIDSSYGPYQGYGLMYTFCLANDACRVRYGAALAEAADLMDALPLQTEQEALRAMLEDDIATDPRAEHSESVQASYLSYMSTCIENCPDSIRDAVE